LLNWGRMAWNVKSYQTPGSIKAKGQEKKHGRGKTRGQEGSVERRR